ncbi:hypothetical protein [Neobacillus massiliamazoniensis]|uniref:hypothetical protein n=1 Tax=Neobacillus massiliamazoniensis TaxID=1499688 RepID=UPI000AA9DBCB|nr:hypothetical protein [Neobacillus massiliamazoniensis]
MFKRKMGLKEVLELIPAGEKYYVTGDIDGIDPSIDPGKGKEKKKKKCFLNWDWFLRDE